MDPATLIVSALALGASAGVKYIAETGIKETYNILKNLIKQKYPDVFIDRMEKNPSSDKQRQAVEEDIQNSGADKDKDIVLAAQKLIEKINEIVPETLQVFGVNIEDVRATSIAIEDISSSGTGVQIKGSEFKGDIDIKKVNSGKSPKA
jgi:hypothetical protein